MAHPICTRFRIAVGYTSAWACSAFLLMSCSVKAPIAGKDLRNQALPQVSVPNKFSTGTNTGTQLDDAWLKQFNDVELETLVAEALKNHPDVRIIAGIEASMITSEGT